MVDEEVSEPVEASAFEGTGSVDAVLSTRSGSFQTLVDVLTSLHFVGQFVDPESWLAHAVVLKVGAMR